MNWRNSLLCWLLQDLTFVKYSWNIKILATHCFYYEQTFTCWNVFYWSRNNIIQYVNHFTLQTKYIKNSLHLVPTKFYKWNECFARSLWSLASLWDHFVLKGCKSRRSRTTLTLIWICFHFIHKIWLVQDIISNMVVVFMSLFMVLFIFLLFLGANS